MKITHEDRLVWGDVARVFPPPREMFERVRCLLGALEETEAELAKERERSKKIAVEAAGYATEVEDLKARLADAKANACGRVQVIDPGEGWRLLRAGEKIEKGDELHFDDGAWEESLDVGLIHLGGDETPKPRRRRVAAQERQVTHARLRRRLPRRRLPDAPRGRAAVLAAEQQRGQLPPVRREVRPPLDPHLRHGHPAAPVDLDAHAVRHGQPSVPVAAPTTSARTAPSRRKITSASKPSGATSPSGRIAHAYTSSRPT